MKILEYEYNGSDWTFSQVSFQKINLIVGDSGTGKTRLLNTIFNLGTFVAQGKPGSEGEWNLTVGIGEKIYRWNVSKIKKGDEIVVEKEQLFLNEKLILDRDNEKFIFDDRPPLPKLSSSQMSLYILKEEELIKPLYDGFSTMLRRRFFDDDLEKNSGIVVASTKSLDRLGGTEDLYELYKRDLALNLRLYVLSKYFRTIFDEIIDYYMETFDFIDEVTIRDSQDFDSIDVPGGAPIFCIKERNVDRWLRLDELSSGMKKVLLILTDLLSLPEGVIYLIDEYENSLGIGGIDFLPNLLSAKDIDFQILFTSHHPYIISNIPVEHWYIAHRNGSQVHFAYGEDLVGRYNVSSQQTIIFHSSKLFLR